MPLPEDWRAFIESLNSHGVEYVVVGAVALARNEAAPRFRMFIGREVRHAAAFWPSADWLMGQRQI
jgi:hypothetical protein